MAAATYRLDGMKGKMYSTVKLSLKSICRVPAVFLLLATMADCSRNQYPTVKRAPSTITSSGFLQDYSQLRPIQQMEGAFGYAQNLDKYTACVINPVEIYSAGDATLPDAARSAVKEYFRADLVWSISGGYPVIETPGPTVLRLRAAVVDISFDTESAAHTGESLTYSLNIGQSRVEIELLDSETGQQIAALVDTENLASRVGIDAPNLTRQEKWAVARDVFDHWAVRMRNFVDPEFEESSDDVDDEGIVIPVIVKTKHHHFSAAPFFH